MPQTEVLKDRGYEILYMTDDIDEFAIQMLGSFEEKTLLDVFATRFAASEIARSKKGETCSM
ncbi:MAG: hypothetical protein IK095_10030, partial [Oscillospiraceae bacterium]|nr:hypothetical protein [Oscillospiraceae bacterium]